MSRNTPYYKDCKNCGREFCDGTVSNRLNLKYCPDCMKAYNEGAKEVKDLTMWLLNHKDWSMSREELIAEVKAHFNAM